MEVRLMNHQKTVSEIGAIRAQISTLGQKVSALKAEAYEAITNERQSLREQLASLKVAEKEIGRA